MARPKLDRWVQSHMRWLALSRWENEGGASPARPTTHTKSGTDRHPPPTPQPAKATPSR